MKAFFSVRSMTILDTDYGTYACFVVCINPFGDDCEDIHAHFVTREEVKQNQVDDSATIKFYLLTAPNLI